MNMALKKLSKDVQSLIESSSHMNCFSKAIEELVYNSVDAKANSVAVRINLEDKSIQVVDNGHGITEEDMPNVGERHMTSKSVDNTTLKCFPKYYGYRGLALAFIIDISKEVKIISRHEATEKSCVTEFFKGIRMDVCEIETRPSKGTTVEIKGFLYNLPVQSKKVDSVQELQEIKQFLEHLSIVQNNVSLSLRDNASNEITFQMPKSKDIYQKINMIYDIESANIQELTVEKDKYKVEGYIGKGIDQQNHIIYLNKRYLEYCKVHKIIDDFFTKHLAIDNNVKHKIKFKHANFKKNLDNNNKNIPFYIIFLNCPYNCYSLNKLYKKHYIEFNNWAAITNLLEKLVKFCIGKDKIDEVKNFTIKANNNKNINDVDIRDKVKNIIKKVLKNNSRISQLHNGVKGKITKRKKKKRKELSLLKIIEPPKNTNPTEPAKTKTLSTKSILSSSIKSLINNQTVLPNESFEISKRKKKKRFDISLSKIIAPQQDRIPPEPGKIKNLSTESILCSSIKSSINNVKNQTISPNESSEIYKTMAPSVIKKRTEHAPKGKKYRYTKTKTRMDFSVLLNKSISDSKNINSELVDKINVILNHINKLNVTNKSAPRSICSKIRKYRTKKNTCKVTINRCVSFPQALKQISKLENNINKCLRLPDDKKLHKRGDLINTILNSQKMTFDSPNKNIAADSKILLTVNNETNNDYDKTYKITSFVKTQDCIPARYINNFILNRETENKLCSTSTIIDLEMVYKNPKELIKQSSKQQHKDSITIDTPKHTYNNDAKTVNGEDLFINHTKSCQKIKNSIPTYDSHKYLCLNNTTKSHPVNNVSYFINNDNFIKDMFIFKKPINPFNNVIKNRKRYYKNARKNKKVLPIIEYSYSIHDDSSDNVKNQLVNSLENLPLPLSQYNERIRTIFLQNALPENNRVLSYNSIDNPKNSNENNNLKELHNNDAIENNNINNKDIEVVFISTSQPKKVNNESISISKPQQSTPSDIFEDCNEKFSFPINPNINIPHANQYYDISNDKEININFNPKCLTTNHKKKSNEITIGLSNQAAIVDSLIINKNTKIITNNENQENFSKHEEEFDNFRYKLIKDNKTEIVSYLDKETGMIVENNIVEDSNVFALKDRLCFIPKGLSPIFANCVSTSKSTNSFSNCDYFYNTLYKDFNNDVQVGSEIFKANIQNLKEFTTKEINKVNIRIQKENADIAFDKNSLESISVLRQVDNKFIAAKMSARKLNSNIITEYLVLFDQHAVDERVRLENNMNDYIIEGNNWKAITLDSFILPLSVEEAIYLHNYRQKFTQFGLKWTSINDKEISVTSIPEAILGKHVRNVEVVINSVKSLIQELVRIIKDQKGSVNLYPRSIMDLVASEACRHAIKFGDHLSVTKCSELLNGLQRCKIPFQCAHGRPVLAVMLEVKSNLPSYQINAEKLKSFSKNK